MRPKSSETSAFAFSFTFVLLQLPRRRAPRVRQLSRRPTPRELEADGEQLRVLAEEYGPVPDAGPEVLNFPLSSISAERTFAMGRAIDLPCRRSQSRSTFCREGQARAGGCELVCSLEALKTEHYRLGV
jgi:hypothetical protein